MKSSTRYDGAVERNLKNAEHRKATKETVQKNGKPFVDYIGKRLDVAKTLIGVRKDDDRFDTRIAALVKGDK